MKVQKCERRVLNSVVPLLLFVTPRLYGTWQMSMTGALQHLGMANNVTDHRLNTRTVMMGPINRFLYLNMNYHVEHHMLTMIHYYKFPAIRELIKQDLPEAEPGILQHTNDCYHSFGSSWQIIRLYLFTTYRKMLSRIVTKLNTCFLIEYETDARGRLSEGTPRSAFKTSL